MVTYRKTHTRMTRGGPPRSLWWLILLPIVLALAWNDVGAQNLINRGKINNRGRFQIHNAASGLPDTVLGLFEFPGSNQDIPARTYKDISLLGNGIKLASGSLMIKGTALVAPAVTLQIPSGELMKFDPSSGRLTEQGYVSGHLQKQEMLAGSGSQATGGIRTPSGFIGGTANAAGSSDLGGIGVSITWGATAPGLTTVDRYSGATHAINVGGKRSITRYFDIQSAVDTSLDASLTFAYAADEAAGFNPASLELWRSPDNGATWRRQRSTHNSFARTLTRTGIRSFGRWTAADGTNPLGSQKFEWEADTLQLIAGNEQQRPANTLLDPFTVRVTDGFMQPVAGATVTFTVTNRPDSSKGDSLSTVTGVSDNNGYVSTQFRLGNATGSYTVVAQVADVPNAQVPFNASARSKASKWDLIAGDGQQDTVRSLLSEFQIIARDDDNAAVPGVRIEFTILKTPLNAIGTALTASTDYSDANGIARTQLQLGNKSGEYLVEVYAPDVSVTKRQTLRVIAVADAPKLVWTQQLAFADTIGTTMSPIGFGLTDVDTNGVAGRDIEFTLAAKPSGSIGDSLLTVTTTTDAAGYATTQLRLGDKVGPYVVDAKATSLPTLTASFSMQARNGRPAQLSAASAVVAVDTIGAMTPIYTALLTDRASNPVPNVPLNFVISAKPDSAAGGSVTLSAGVTDSSGSVTTQLILGIRTGLYRVSATTDTVPGLFAEFFAQARPGVPARLDTINVFAESKPILEPLDSLFTVRLADRENNPLAGETVSFAVTPVAGSSGASLSAVSVTTDTFGFARTRLTLGDKVGTYVVTATTQKLAGHIQTFAASALQGAPQTIASMTPDQVKPILEPLDSSLTVALRDKGGNPVSGASVYFAVLEKPEYADSTTLSADTVTTGADGLAQSVFRVGSKVGRYVVLAMSSALPNDSIKFKIQAIHGAAANLLATSDQADTAEVGQKLLPFTLTVFDLGMNPVPYAPVQFTITTQPANAAGQFLSAVADTSDSLGQVSTILTLGDHPGVYEIEAISGSLPKGRFTGLATFTVGDPNSSGRIDIADLTQLIDHMIGKSVMSGVDSARSDINRDGRINILDIQILRDRLLTNAWFVAPNAQIPSASNDGDGDGLNTAEISSRPADVPSGTPEAMADYAAATTIGSMEVTNAGMRFNLKNDVPVKGIEFVLVLANPVNVTKPDVVFPRASFMNVLVSSSGDTIRAVVFNTKNTPIMPDSGVLFRLAVKLKDTSEIVSTTVIISTGANIASYLPGDNINKSIPLLPQDWVLAQNYPNPFNPSTTIEYEVPEINGKLARVAIQIFNILGEKVRTIDRAHRDAGRYKVTWDGKNDAGVRVATGVYIYRLLSPDKQISKKMIMLK